MRDFITRFAFWLLVKTGAQVLVISPSANVAVNRAEELVRLTNELSDPATGGEFKHAVVLGQLVKDFPKVRKRDLNTIIELAVRSA